MESTSPSEFSNPSGVYRIITASLAMLRPPPDLAPSEWAEQHVRIPEGNKVPGLYRTANAPIQREPMDQFINPECYRVTLMWGAQTGKTTCALAVQGYAIAQRPRSQMMLQPSQADLKTWLETKFNPLSQASDAIGNLIAKPRGREGVNNQSMKSYPGGFLMFAWSGSTRTMRGRSAPLIVCDEVDGYSTTNEGHPVSLIWQRAATFGDDRFLLEISTPTMAGASYIESAFEAGDQRYFHVPCPHCGQTQVLNWTNIKWTGRRSTELHDATADLETEEHEPASARYMCEHCGVLWNDGERMAALRDAETHGGGWRPSRPFKGHASYHAWEAYSVFRRLEDIVQDYLEKLRVDDLQSFANVSLARTYELKGEGVDANSLFGKRYAFPDYLPDGVLYITLGADMQTDRLEYEIVGWGQNGETWSIEYGVLWGDPLAGQVFDELEHIIRETRFVRSDGSEAKINASAMDTGGTTGYPQAAWDWLRGKTSRRIFGVKGYSPSWGSPIVSAPSHRRSGRIRRRVDIFNVAVDEAKLVVMRRISQTVAASAPGAPGFMHVPEDRDEEWFKQLTAESLVVKKGKNGKANKASRREWVKPSKARNEALDCRVYAYAAMKIMNPDLVVGHPDEDEGLPSQDAEEHSDNEEKSKKGVRRPRRVERPRRRKMA